MCPNKFNCFEWSLWLVVSPSRLLVLLCGRVFVFIPLSDAIWWIVPLRLIVYTNTIISTIFCNLICRKQSSLRCFHGGRSFVSIFGWHPIRSPNLYLIGILVRSSFLSVPWSFCRTSVPILIVSLHNLLLSTCNSFFRIGPALVSLGSGASLIYFGTPVMRYAFWHITSILSLSVLASLRVNPFGVSRSRLMRCPNMVRKGSARLPLRIFESIGFPSCVLVDRPLINTFVKYFRYSRPL